MEIHVHVLMRDYKNWFGGFFFSFYLIDKSDTIDPVFVRSTQGCKAEF